MFSGYTTIKKCTESGVSKKMQIGQPASNQPASTGNQRETSQQPAGNHGQPAGNQPATSGQPAGNQRSTGSEVPSILFTGFASPKFKNHEDYRLIGKISANFFQKQKNGFSQRFSRALLKKSKSIWRPGNFTYELHSSI